MPLWTYTRRPNWPALIPDTIVKSTPAGWARIDTGELLVAIDQFDEKHDVDVCNLELEAGDDFLLEDSTHGDVFIELESC